MTTNKALTLLAIAVLFGWLYIGQQVTKPAAPLPTMSPQVYQPPWGPANRDSRRADRVLRATRAR